MRRFSCIVCGATESLSFWPDSCSSCGGSLTTEHPVQSEEFYPTPADVVRHWMRGGELSAKDAAVLDGLVRQNSVEQLLHLERAA